MKEIILNQNQFFEVDKISNGSYSPLKGFMTENEFYSVIDNYSLPDGRLFSIPIFLDISKDTANNIKLNSTVKLRYDNDIIGEVHVESLFSCDKKNCAKKIYGTDEINHAGVAAFYKTKEVFITSQNHGFAVDEKTLPSNISASHVSLFDQSLQGIAFTDKPAFSFQGHPEASPGPQEIQTLFKKFQSMVVEYAKT